MLGFITFLVMLAVAYAHFREGLFTALTTLVNVILAGLITFNFYEPLANLLDPLLARTPLAGIEDYFAMLFLFCVCLGLLRLVTNNLANRTLEFVPVFNQIGGAAVGLVTGYLACGFIVCVLQTLPWHENFMDFSPRSEKEGGLRRYFPPDRVWLSLMRHAGAGSLARRAPNPHAESAYDRYSTFDREGTFELRYLRHRRYGDARNPIPYQGELDNQLGPPSPE